MTDEAAAKNLEIWLSRFETFRPKDGHGTIAAFDVVIAHVLEIKKMKLRKLTDGRVTLTSPRLERQGGFPVELRRWIAQKIRLMAIEKLREIAQSDLALLGGSELGEDDLPPPVPGLDAAALPARLLREVRV